jgi:hypothetical protein
MTALTGIAGDFRLLQGEPALILNSRQSKTPVGADSWVRGTVEAVGWAVAKDYPVIASIGMNVWELVLWAVANAGGKAIVLFPTRQEIPDQAQIQCIADDFRLDAERHAWLAIPSCCRSPRCKDWWKERDSLAVSLAGTLVPVSVRCGGSWEDFLETTRDGQVVNETFRVKYGKTCGREMPIEISGACLKIDDWPWLTHWTRRCYGPWAGERSADFYGDIVGSGDSYPRSAFHTLRRILNENLLRASTEHIRNQEPVVAFTSLQPSDALKLMRWRKRYVRPTFEPYGIAVHRRLADKLGLRPVTYVKSGEKGEGFDPRFLQGYGTGDWPAEAEWRAGGNVDLSTLDENDVIVLVPSPKEAEILRGLTRFHVQPLAEHPRCD